MIPIIPDTQIPEAIAKLSDQPRVVERRSGAPRRPARAVVYWMQRAMRIVGNPALDVAIEADAVRRDAEGWRLADIVQKRSPSQCF